MKDVGKDILKNDLMGPQKVTGHIARTTGIVIGIAGGTTLPVWETVAIGVTSQLE